MITKNIFFSRFNLYFLTSLLLILFQTSCIKKKSLEALSENSKTFLADKNPKKLSRAIIINEIKLWVEVVDDLPSRSQGLMYRQSLAKNQGMLFVFDKPQMQSFWMKNTYIPLSIAFFSENKELINILDMSPGVGLSDDKLPRYKSLSPAKFALEVNQGWFSKKNIRPGHRFEFESL